MKIINNKEEALKVALDFNSDEKVDPHFYDDEDFMLAVIKQFPEEISRSKKLSHDKDFVLNKAIVASPYSLTFTDFANDEECAVKAVSLDEEGVVYKALMPNMRNNLNVILSAYRKNKTTALYFDVELMSYLDKHCKNENDIEKTIIEFFGQKQSQPQ